VNSQYLIKVDPEDAAEFDRNRGVEPFILRGVGSTREYAVSSIDPAPATERDVLIRRLAELLAGCEVPGSIHSVLGKAHEPWREIHGEAGFGWIKAEDYEQYLRSVLG
jgi:hypothetical protein